MRHARTITLTLAVLPVLASMARADEVILRDRRIERLDGRRGQDRRYYVRVPDGARRLTVTTGGGRGDVDLYAAPGRVWGDGPWRAKSAGGDTRERIGVDRPRAGWWRGRLAAVGEYRGVALTIRRLPTGSGTTITSRSRSWNGFDWPGSAAASARWLVRYWVMALATSTAGEFFSM